MKHVTLKNHVTQTGQNKAGDTVEHCVTECYHVTKLYIDTRKDIRQAVCSTYTLYTLYSTYHSLQKRTGGGEWSWCMRGGAFPWGFCWRPLPAPPFRTELPRNRHITLYSVTRYSRPLLFRQSILIRSPDSSEKLNVLNWTLSRTTLSIACAIQMSGIEQFRASMLSRTVID